MIHPMPLLLPTLANSSFACPQLGERQIIRAYSGRSSERELSFAKYPEFTPYTR